MAQLGNTNIYGTLNASSEIYENGKRVITTATSTGSGNAITSMSVSGNTLTFTKGDTFSQSTHTHTKSQIDDFPTLSKVATSGNYSDLTGTPTIPTVDNTLSSTSTNAIQNKAVYSALDGKADKVTTLSGYGITDAKISNGVITLGTNTITPLTKHQDISGKEDSSNKVTSWSATTSNTKYPSEKLVKDSLDSKASKDIFSTTASGLVPKPTASSTTSYLNATGGWSNPNTLDSHYTPQGDANSILTSGVINTSTPTIAWTTDSSTPDSLVTGVSISRDSKGHVTGLNVSSANFPKLNSITQLGTITSALNVSGVASFTNTTESTSTTTGAVKISGGLGVAGNIYSFRSYINVSNSTSSYSTYSFSTYSYSTYSYSTSCYSTQSFIGATASSRWRIYVNSSGNLVFS